MSRALDGEAVAAIHRPGRMDTALLSVAVVSAGMSGPLIAAIGAPALAIAFWRNVLGVGALAPHALWRHRAEFRRIRRAEAGTTLAAGLVLGAHFAAWTTSVTMTSVASATAFVSAQPIFAALIARFRGEEVPRRAWTGILVAVGGVVALSGADLQVSGEAFAGDLLALFGGALGAIYMTLGTRARQVLSLTPYTVMLYSVAALLLGIAALAMGRSLTGISADDWIKIVALTCAAQLLGHTLFNRVLKTTSATVVSLAILLQVPLAAVVAAVFLDQVPSWTAVPGVLLLLFGLQLVVTRRVSRS